MAEFMELVLLPPKPSKLLGSQNSRMEVRPRDTAGQEPHNPES